MSRQSPFNANVAFGFIATLVGAIAGAGVCVASMHIVGFWAIALGVAAMVAILFAAKGLQKRLDANAAYNAVGSVVGLVVATPVALFAGYALSFVVKDTADGSDAPLFVVMVLVPFLVWSVATWIGLQWKAGWVAQL